MSLRVNRLIFRQERKKLFRIWILLGSKIKDHNLDDIVQGR